jgi:hypothetical protein
MVCSMISECSFFVWNQNTKDCNLFKFSASSQLNTLNVINSNDLIVHKGCWFGWISFRAVVIGYNQPIKAPTNAPSNPPSNPPSNAGTTGAPVVTVSTTTPAWWQWLGYDCSDAGGVLIDTIENVPFGVNNAIVANNQPGNCLLLCYDNPDCGFFVYNQSNLQCRLYQGTRRQISGRCRTGQTGFNTGWLGSRDI